MNMKVKKITYYMGSIVLNTATLSRLNWVSRESGVVQRGMCLYRGEEDVSLRKTCFHEIEQCPQRMKFVLNM
jgi:hypothetical protein